MREGVAERIKGQGHTFVSLLPENTCKGYCPTIFLGSYRIETHGYVLAREILYQGGSVGCCFNSMYPDTDFRRQPEFWS